MSGIHPTIDVLYSCPDCGIKDAVVPVRAREQEDVVTWMQCTVATTLARDHLLKSPDCPAVMLHTVKIPMNGPRVGAPAAH